MILPGELRRQGLQHHIILDGGPILAEAVILPAHFLCSARIRVFPNSLLIIWLGGEFHRLEVVLGGGPHLTIQGNGCRIEIAELPILVASAIETDLFAGIRLFLLLFNLFFSLILFHYTYL